MTGVVDDVAARVEAACHNDTNVFGAQIWDHHILRVVENARWLAEELGADRETVTVAALLHDYASLVDPDYIDAHHEHGARLAAEVLDGRYDDERVGMVQHCIRAHRGSRGPDPSSPAAHCVASGDGMAHIQAVPSLLRAAYVHRGMSVADGVAWVAGKLDGSWEKLHPVAADRVRGRYHAARTVLDAEGTEGFEGSSAVAFRDHG
jgi:uncharacterized protein